MPRRDSLVEDEGSMYQYFLLGTQAPLALSTKWNTFEAGLAITKAFAAGAFSGPRSRHQRHPSDPQPLQPSPTPEGRGCVLVPREKSTPNSAAYQIK